MRTKFLILLSIVLFAYTCAYAQNNQYQFSHLDISNGLSHNQINCIYKDSQGFMWFGTMSGLNRYDGYTFKIFKHKNKDSTSINDNYIINIYEGPQHKLWILTRGGYNVYDPITEKFDQNFSKQLSLLNIHSDLKSIKKDKFGNFWFVDPKTGVYKHDPVTKKTTQFKHVNGDGSSLYSNTITDISANNNGDIWIIYLNGLFEKIDHKTNKIAQRVYVINKLYGQQKNYYNLFSDKQNGLWIFDPGNPHGVYYFNQEKNIFKNITKNSGIDHLSSDLVTNITQDDKNIIWVGTDHGGVNLIDKSDFKIKCLVNKEDDNKSLCQNSTSAIYTDKSGIVWIGTYKKGISYYHEDIIKFPIVKHSLTDQNSLTYNDVNRFAEDDKGNLWIGTNGKGLIYYNRKTGTFKNYINNPLNSNSLCNNVVVSLHIDYKKQLWIGTYFGGMDCYDGKTFKHYKHSNTLPGTICDDRVSDIIEDSSHQLWVGTMGGGLDLFNPEKNTFTHFSYDSFPPINSGYISRLVKDEHNNIWIGTSYGMNVLLNGSGKTISYHQSDVGKNALVNDNITGLLEDSRHLFWISTRDGLSIFNPKTQKFVNLSIDDGLPDNTILDVLEDNAHNIWISTGNGLCTITVSGKNDDLHFKFKNYNETDGLQAQEFNQYASLKTKSGELIFGGANGFNIFNPAYIRPNPSKVKLIFTDLLLFNKSVNPNQAVNGHIILNKSISQTPSVTLNHNENVFTIEFAALTFFDPNKVKHQYMMEGFDKDWLTADNTNRKATYTNLDAGDYVFKVKASNSDNIDNTDYITLNIKIKPPFWNTKLAYFFYLLAILGILLYIRRRGIQKIENEFTIKQEKLEMQRVLEHERREVKRMHELDMMKIKFFTNVSHEFRTPLSLIMAPVDKMLKNTADTELQQQIKMIKTNARRLLNLVNQLLDFRKMEVQELKLHVEEGDIISFIKEISSSFKDIADQKHIGFLFDSEVDILLTSFDRDKIERILFNLLSNAFKFTSRGGHVSVLLNLLTERSTANTKLLEIKIIDTGIGIPKDMHDKIFSRFFQNDIPDSLLNQGSGIGLAITREFVKMHNGQILVESEPDSGSCFIIQLPLDVKPDVYLKPISTDSDEMLSEHMEMILDESILGKNITVQKPKKPIVLIVEDNDDFRFYLKDNLKDLYTVLEASNGKEGWQKALSSHPNIMVSDISMPEMNGIELCKKIKNDERTFHIPVILLTALIGEEEELKGLQIGANDYMTKPFNFEILLSKIKNLLILQQIFKKTYTKQMHLQLENVEVESADELFLCNAVDYIQKNILNPALSVEDLSRQMNMSRVSLYKKVLAISGKSPIELIRHIKLQKAAQLLEKSQLNITGVCYEVGFNNPTYFSKIFKEEFNMLPSDYVSMVRKKDLANK